MSNYLSEQIYSLNIPQFCLVFNILNFHNVDNYFENYVQLISTSETIINNSNNFILNSFYRDPCNVYFFFDIPYNLTSHVISSSTLLFREDISLFLFVSKNHEFLDSLNSEIAETNFLALSMAYSPGIYINLARRETTLICISCQEGNRNRHNNLKINLKNAPQNIKINSQRASHLKIPFANILGIYTMGYGGPHSYKELFPALYFGRMPLECRGYLTFVSILAGKLNLTLELDPFLDDENPNPFTIMHLLILGLHALPMFRGVLKEGGNFALNAAVVQPLYYCVPYSRFMRPDWAIFFAPFQIWVWAAAVLVIAGVCLLVQLSFKNSGGTKRRRSVDLVLYYSYEMIRAGLFVVKGCPDQHVGSRLNGIPLLLISLFSYNFLQPAYLGRVTSAFITPGKIEEVRDLYTLLTHRGYKLHFDTTSVINNVDIANLNFRMRGNQINRETQISVWNDNSKKARLFEHLRDIKNIEKTQKNIVLSKMLGSRDHFVVGGVKCVLLLETDHVVNQIYVGIKYFKGHELTRVFAQMQETGFEKFWRDVESFGRGEYWRRVGVVFGSGEVKGLSIYSHIQILFYIFLMTKGVAILVFIGEVWSEIRLFTFNWGRCHGNDVIILL
ncbi:hypothetical protein Fcan01_26853 [Folsomia candida]|uniref:Uncharacterized protein n=1 Tax=Folsomia candida TaxID=158441 RepID=A0A226D0L0_FOLCA|nr:hypothetical protein Fcan01_26853 [Folsomia candida]